MKAKIEKGLKKKKKPLTMADYLSTITGCLIIFFITTILLYTIRQEPLPNIAYLIGESTVPAVMAIIISLVSRLPFVGIGIISFFVKGELYEIFREIYNWSPVQASNLSLLAIVIITAIGVGLCWVIKNIITLTISSSRPSPPPNGVGSGG